MSNTLVKIIINLDKSSITTIPLKILKNLNIYQNVEEN